MHILSRIKAIESNDCLEEREGQKASHSRGNLQYDQACCDNLLIEKPNLQPRLDQQTPSIMRKTVIQNDSSTVLEKRRTGS